jgi:hypothetical protein
MSPSIPDLAANPPRLDGSWFAHVTLKDQKYAEYTENIDPVPLLFAEICARLG